MHLSNLRGGRATRSFLSQISKTKADQRRCGAAIAQRIDHIPSCFVLALSSPLPVGLSACVLASASLMPASTLLPFPLPGGCPPSRLLPLLSDWIQTLSRVHFDDDVGGDHDSTNNARGSGQEQGQSRGTAAAATASALGPSTSAAQVRVCASLLSRCLAARNSANTVVSKFVELRIDEEDEGGGGGGGKSGGKGGAGRGGGAASSSSAPSALAGKKPRLQIRMEGVRERGRG